MSLPLVSVAIPAYNHARYIDACLQSVYAQTYPNIELVVIDDGSKDETAARIHEFLTRHGGRFQNVIFRSRPNQGVCVTSNEAIAACTGEWVHLLGSDDLIYPEKIRHQHLAIEAWDDQTLALVYSDADYIDENGRRLPITQRSRPNAGPDHAAYRYLFQQNPITNPTVALKREAFLDIGGFDESLKLEDWDCWLRLSTKYSIARLPLVLAGYRYHPHNTSRNQRLMLHSMLLTFAKFLESHGELVPAKMRRENFRKNLHRLYRWAKKNNPGMLLPIGIDSFVLGFRIPEPNDYRRYADRLAISDMRPVF